MNRREFVVAASGAGLAAVAAPMAGRQAAGAPVHTFSRETVVRHAEQLARTGFSPPVGVAEPFNQLGYDQYRDIRYRKEFAYWLAERRGFTLEFLHAGFIYKNPVRIYIVEDGTLLEIHYNSHLFEFGPSLYVPPIHDKPLFTGFRVRAPMQSSEYLDEFIIFQGASYFRALGTGQLYGVSARGLAVDTAEPHGEEFPFFRTFWIERPGVGAKSITVHALLDSVSVTGAFSFRITPGHPTVIEVKATLFARRELKHLGIAPLTSMYLFGSLEKTRFDDYRSAVHDSDSLAIAGKEGGWTLRPLANPRSLQLSSFGRPGGALRAPP
jgi:periplasmic glucans biosynthesis protein